MTNPFSNILVPVELDPDEKAVTSAAIDLAKSLAKKTDGKLHLLHVAPPLEAQEALAFDHGAAAALEQVLKIRMGKLETTLGDWADDIRADGIVTETHLVTDVRSVAETICAVAEEQKSDVVVMSSHGRSRVKRVLLGSVADRVAHTIDIPVMLTRPPIG